MSRMDIYALLDQQIGEIRSGVEVDFALLQEWSDGLLAFSIDTDGLLFDASGNPRSPGDLNYDVLRRNFIKVAALAVSAAQIIEKRKKNELGHGSNKSPQSRPGCDDPAKGKVDEGKS